MTSLFMIVEITQEYQILVPLRVANFKPVVTSRRFQPAPLYDTVLEEDGIPVPGR
jgi:H+/Cl- antiporter ClcA